MVNTKRNSKKKFHPPFEKKKSGLFSFLLFFLCLCVFKKLKRKAVYADMRTYWSSTHTHTGEKPMQSTMYIFFFLPKYPDWSVADAVKYKNRLYTHNRFFIFVVVLFGCSLFGFSFYIPSQSMCVCVCATGRTCISPSSILTTAEFS